MSIDQNGLTDFPHCRGGMDRQLVTRMLFSEAGRLTKEHIIVEGYDVHVLG